MIMIMMIASYSHDIYHTAMNIMHLWVNISVLKIFSILCDELSFWLLYELYYAHVHNTKKKGL